MTYRRGDVILKVQKSVDTFDLSSVRQNPKFTGNFFRRRHRFHHLYRTRESMTRLGGALTALVAMLAVSANAFTSPAPKVSQQSKTQLFGTTKQPPAIPAPKELSYGEESRKYRRTVYTHDDWVKHRSPERFTRNLVSTTNSGIYKNIGNEVLATTGVALFVMLWNMLTGSYADFAGVEHLGIWKDTILPVLSLPLAPFTLSSPSLGLLLVFRTNAGYQRWDEARKNWGYVIAFDSAISVESQ
jgi:hypothetical protein